MLDILVHSGIKPKAYQENRRTDFLLGKVTISLDEWPKIPPYIEIEGPNEQSVLEVAKKLGYSKDDLTSLNTKKVYLNYGINLDEISELKF
jgi:adenylate cyclase class 2